MGTDNKTTNPRHQSPQQEAHMPKSVRAPFNPAQHEAADIKPQAEKVSSEKPQQR